MWFHRVDITLRSRIMMPVNDFLLALKHGNLPKRLVQPVLLKGERKKFSKA